MDWLIDQELWKHWFSTLNKRKKNLDENDSGVVLLNCRIILEDLVTTKRFQDQKFNTFFFICFQVLTEHNIDDGWWKRKKTNKQTITRPRNLCLLYDTQESKTKKKWCKIKKFLKKTVTNLSNQYRFLFCVVYPSWSFRRRRRRKKWKVFETQNFFLFELINEYDDICKDENEFKNTQQICTRNQN